MGAHMYDGLANLRASRVRVRPCSLWVLVQLPVERAPILAKGAYASQPVGPPGFFLDSLWGDLWVRAHRPTEPRTNIK